MSIFLSPGETISAMISLIFFSLLNFALASFASPLSLRNSSNPMLASTNPFLSTTLALIARSASLFSSYPSLVTPDISMNVINLSLRINSFSIPSLMESASNYFLKPEGSCISIVSHIPFSDNFSFSSLDLLNKYLIMMSLRISFLLTLLSSEDAIQLLTSPSNSPASLTRNLSASNCS